MTFTHPKEPPAGNNTSLQVALWHARDRSGDTRQSNSAKQDEAWYAVLEEGAAVITKLPLTELTKRYPCGVGQVMYRPYAAAAAHVRWIVYKMKSAGKTAFADLEESAAAMEAYQLTLDASYGLRDGAQSGNAARSTPLVRG